jgi:peptidoglycan hydrolase CwlO-like protein
MTETLTPDTVADLKSAVREASQYERDLAREVDNLPNLIKDAARADARRQARAAREGGAGKAVQEAAQESTLPALRERQSALPYLRWSAGIRTASLELELADATIAESEQRAKELRVGLEGLKADADEAQRIFEERASAVRRAESGASMTGYSRRTALSRLRDLEAEYPGIS